MFNLISMSEIFCFSLCISYGQIKWEISIVQNAQKLTKTSVINPFLLVEYKGEIQSFFNIFTPIKSHPIRYTECHRSKYRVVNKRHKVKSSTTVDGLWRSMDFRIIDGLILRVVSPTVGRRDSDPSLLIKLLKVTIHFNHNYNERFRIQLTQ